MPQTTRNPVVLQEACRALVDAKSYNDSWVLAGLTDRSFEVGNATEFTAEVEHYRSARVSPSCVAKLRKGINGNLADILNHQNPDLKVQPNYRGPDLNFLGPDGRNIKAEIKLIHDCTEHKYFQNNVAGDLIKLSNARSVDDVLFLVVFFITLPNYWYPSGEWFGKPWESRCKYMKTCGIVDQFDKVKMCLRKTSLRHDLVWPDTGCPHVGGLKALSRRIVTALNGLYAENFHAYALEPWRFRPSTHLVGAQVGVAVWRIP